jgi:cell wall assembly regulator SMI1
MQVVLDRMKYWIDRGPINIVFNKGVKLNDISKAETKLNIEFPEELKEYLMIFNGESGESHGIIGNWMLLELKYILKEWQRLTKSFGDLRTSLNDKSNLSSSYVKQMWWNNKWIPIVSSGSGHYICADIDPGKKGSKGQIILFLHDEQERYLIANSLKEWFSTVTGHLEKGIYRIITDKDGYKHFNSEAFMWTSIEGKHIYGKPEK